MEKKTSTDQIYKVKITNESKRAWTFFVYQTPPANAQSLAWFASPYKIDVGDNISFTWEIDYQFQWDNTGVLQPGVNFTASGGKACDPAGNNMTKFTVAKDSPHLDPSTPGAPKGTLVIDDGPEVPPNTFSVGLAMSGNGIYVVNAGPNLSHVFTPTPTYWVSAMNNVKVGDVMDMKTISQTAELRFPPNVYQMSATLTDKNQWEIKKL